MQKLKLLNATTLII